MLKTKKIRRRTKNYEKSTLVEALAAVQERHMSVHRASQIYSIPKSSLQRYTINGIRTPQIATELKSEEEQELVHWLNTIVELGFIIKSHGLKDAVQFYLNGKNRITIFTENRPGKVWHHRFFRRHETVGRALDEFRKKNELDAYMHWINKVRKKNKTNSSVNLVFNLKRLILSEYLQMQDLLTSERNNAIFNDPRRVFTFSESALHLNSTDSTSLFARGSKKRNDDNENDEFLSILFGCNANGECPPMMFTSKSKSKDDTKHSKMYKVNNSSEFLERTASGWTDPEAFFNYMSTEFQPWTQTKNIPSPIAVFLDRRYTSLSLQLTDFCASNGILLIGLPTNSVQPFYFGVKLALETILMEQRLMWQKQNAAKRFKRTVAIDLLHETLTEMQNNRFLFSNAFQEAGKL